MSNQNLISVYRSQIDGQLLEAERHMMGLSLTDSYIQTMEDPSSEDDYIIAKSGLWRRLSSDLSTYPFSDGFFVYSIDRQDEVEAYKGSLNYSELTGIREEVKKTVAQMAQYPLGKNTKWHVKKINGSYYLMRIFKNNNFYLRFLGAGADTSEAAERHSVR